MCNLYRLQKPANEVASFFGQVLHDLRVSPGNVPEQVYPGYPGLVLAQATVQPMVWGFPLVLKGAAGQPLKPKPVNNARTDKLATGFWAASFRDRRCLIPLTGWAEAEGPKGGKTRTWLAPADTPLFAVAGCWRETAEWGRAYTMVMTDAGGAAAAVHNRMPVILRPDQWASYLTADPASALALCRPYDGEIRIERTNESWAARR